MTCHCFFLESYFPFETVSKTLAKIRVMASVQCDLYARNTALYFPINYFNSMATTCELSPQNCLMTALGKREFLLPYNLTLTTSHEKNNSELS